MNDGFQFRQLLDKHGLVELAGGESDALDWLETQIIGLADSVARRERLRKLLRQAREGLTREQDARHPDGDSPQGERKERPNPYVEVRFRKIKL
jgi:hypothetical protein